MKTVIRLKVLVWFICVMDYIFVDVPLRFGGLILGIIMDLLKTGYMDLYVSRDPVRTQRSVHKEWRKGQS